MSRALQFLQCPDSPNLILGENQGYGFESAVGSKCHVSSDIVIDASLANSFATVNNSASINFMSNELGDLVRARRTELGFTQEQLADLDNRRGATGIRCR